MGKWGSLIMGRCGVGELIFLYLDRKEASLDAEFRQCIALWSVSALVHGTSLPGVTEFICLLAAGSVAEIETP